MLRVRSGQIRSCRYLSIGNGKVLGFIRNSERVLYVNPLWGMIFEMTIVKRFFKINYAGTFIRVGTVRERAILRKGGSLFIGINFVPTSLYV